MLCGSIDDSVETRSGRVAGLGLLDADIVFGPDKVLHRWQGGLRGYEIRHGRVVRCTETAWFEVDGCAHGYRRGGVFGTHWHGLFDNNAFRRQWLTAAAAGAGRDGFVVADDVDVTARRDAQLDLMADLVAAHLDTPALAALLAQGAPQRPTIVAGLRAACGAGPAPSA